MTKTLAQMETEAIAWINIAILILCIPLFGCYSYQTLDGVDDVRFFLEEQSRGREFAEVIIKFFLLIVIWMPMSVILKIAASQRNYGLLKVWNFFQVVLIFIVALHLLIKPPASLIMVLAYATIFLYFLISLWICESLIKETKEELKANFAPSTDPEAQPVVLLNDAVTAIEGQAFDDCYSIQMKKVLK